jgi:hypothetical protein
LVYKSVMANKIIINRKSEWRNRNRGFQVFIDGKEVGKIANGSSEEYQTEPGMHTLQCKIAWCSSPALTITVKEGENSFVTVGSAMRYYNVGMVLALLVIVTGFGIPSFLHVPLPSYFGTVQLAVFLPFLAYLLYYQTLGRKKYITIAEDANNIFR